MPEKSLINHDADMLAVYQRLSAWHEFVNDYWRCIIAAVAAQIDARVMREFVHNAR